MNPMLRVAVGLSLLVVVAGCASTKITSQQPYDGAALPRPDRIIVEDFGATPAEIPADSALEAQPAAAAPQTAEDIEVGRELGAEIAKQLTVDLQDMGLPAVHGADQAPPRPGDVVI